jgi:hypothetical protein
MPPEEQELSAFAGGTRLTVTAAIDAKTRIPNLVAELVIGFPPVLWLMLVA